MIANFDKAVKTWAVSALVDSDVDAATAEIIATENLEALLAVAQAKLDALTTEAERPSMQTFAFRNAVAEEIDTWTKANLVPT